MISKQLLTKLLEEGHEKFGEDYDWEQIMSDIKDFPDDPEKNQDVVDKIRLDMALETPVWQMIYATEPLREIDVRMSYADLARIYRRMVYSGNDV